MRPRSSHLQSGDAVFTNDGSPLRIPNGFGRSRAAAWSPPGVEGQAVTVPIDVTDLAWQ